jgi:hypothetical protein
MGMETQLIRRHHLLHGELGYEDRGWQVLRMMLMMGCGLWISIPIMRKPLLPGD